MSMFRIAVAGILLLPVLLLQGCARKGPLFMPPEQAKPAKVIQPQAEQTLQNQTETKK